MGVTVTIHRDQYLSDTVKYRAAYPTPAAYGPYTLVSNGNFASKDIFEDNTIELALNPQNGVDSNFIIISGCNVIKLVHDWSTTSCTVIGHITSCQYINDSNIRISYSVDAFSSARASGWIESMSGLCERTHLDYAQTQSFINLAPEPFTPQDTMRAASLLSEKTNQIVYDLEGVTVTSAAIFSDQTRVVVTFSPAVIQFLGNPTPFRLMTESDITQEMKIVDDFNFLASDTTMHSGGIFRGRPLMFQTFAQLNPFIKKLLGGCGFRTILPPDGYDNDGVVRRQMLTPDNTGGGNSINDIMDQSGAEIESTRFITGQDIYNVYVLPTAFCQNVAGTFTSYGNIIDGLPSTSDMHGLGAEDNTKSKLLAYPYFYIKAVTSNGDVMTLSPQTFNKRTGVWQNNSTLMLDLKFIGGDTPRLMGRFVPAFVPDTPNSSSTVAEWFTVRSYPAISLGLNNSYNPQLQKDYISAKRLTALYTNAVTSAGISSPIRQGYLDTVNNTERSNSNRGLLSQIAYEAGNLLGNTFSQAGLFNDNVQQEFENSVRNENVNSIVSPDIGSIEGNDFLMQFATPPFSMYNCGASNGEVFTFCRYLDQFGSACNCILNPLDNTGNIYNTGAFVTSYQGRTYYQFAYIDIQGVMPIPWKRKIKDLFESGVYLRG